MKGLKKLLAIGGMLLALSNCEEHYTEYSDIIHEDAKVINKQEIGSKWGSYYYITIKGEENRIFKLNDKKLYDNLELGDRVDLTYRECYTLTLDDTNKDGKLELIENKFSGYVFEKVVKKEQK